MSDRISPARAPPVTSGQLMSRQIGPPASPQYQLAPGAHEALATELPGMATKLELE